MNKRPVERPDGNEITAAVQEATGFLNSPSFFS
jgi:hypothetical protein